MNTQDSNRFVKSLTYFNSREPIGSIAEFDRKTDSDEDKVRKPLVKIIAFCLNPNHFHLILEQLEENGISRYMKSLLGGFTKYFNAIHRRSGCLLQGPYKAKHINDNNYLLHLSAYVNLNNRLHKIGNRVSDFVRSSWKEYTIGTSTELCNKDIVLEQFKSRDDYKKYALELLPDMIEKRKGYKELEHLMFD
ncbi:MAG TPA: transposase [Candidatus Paceibacterota bacterium]